MTFGEKLKELRLNKDWTQPEAAEAIGIEQSYLSKLENGKSIPSDEIFEQLIHGYGTSLSALIDGLEDDEADRLRDIDVVRSHLSVSRAQAEKSTDRKVIGGIISIVLGIGLVMSGQLALFAPDTRYEYKFESDEFTSTTAKKLQQSILYFNPENQVDAAGDPTGRTYLNLTLSLAQEKSRFEDRYVTHWEYRGNHIIKETEDGPMTYELISERRIINQNNQVMMVIGLMSLVLGALLLAFSRKKRK